MVAMDPVGLSNEPLSLVPPDIAAQVQFQRYMWAGTVAVFIWDILNNIKADYNRILCLVYVLGFTIFLTSPAGNCRILDLILNSLYPIAVPSTSLLFFFRVRAIYGGTLTITAVFGILWVMELAACIPVPFGTGGTNIESTRYCLVAELAPSIGGAAIAPTVFDTAVFLAISYRLIGNAHIASSRRQTWRVMFRAAHLPSFSKTLFVDGQVYYMITVISNIAMSVMCYVPGLIAGWRSLPALSNVMLTSVMTCRVYRHTRLGFSQDVPSSTPSPLAAANASLSLKFVCPTRDDCSLFTVPLGAVENGEQEDSRRASIAEAHKLHCDAV
ncbi:hypothetical protein B0H17DRAFT_1186358 [Mycena rosella]|uniref:Transmembrane protein n=1 Tax=Mycena rosella TaxID=1033263 RepID=A0AAD7G057_MYCRO|nr:hypothetical protein B0H17DRAFT_1186358 [Mycena rosella]